MINLFYQETMLVLKIGAALSVIVLLAQLWFAIRHPQSAIRHLFWFAIPYPLLLAVVYLALPWILLVVRQA